MRGIVSIVTALAFAFGAGTAAPLTASNAIERRATAISAKKGVGYNDASLTRNLAISWAYNWGQTPSGALTSGVEYVPMLNMPRWSANAGTTWAANAQAALNRGSKHLLAFNEPDLQGQADMTINQSVAAWKQYMSPFVGQAKLGSMAVTNGGAPMGPAYIKAFFDACPECEAEVDFVCVHWYDTAVNLGWFKNFLSEAYTLLNKPIWLTEFAGSGTVAEQITFLQEVISWMNEPAQSYIQRFAGFGDFVGTYVNADGSLTALGQAYSTASGKAIKSSPGASFRSFHLHLSSAAGRRPFPDLRFPWRSRDVAASFPHTQLSLTLIADVAGRRPLAS
ncbi:hypothetical protein BMF94_1937 [Rhodotorula taiwanensis]|uniref:Asl1-like glycosyl hydrolase catalytic domain-containing protein n=1 Tax=Rhodotorula taiwanensis TaxID=741276 RepID=A0A2S5BDY6_9BASI|nr:hypothetical protein BMF94_1937 [Rhodotorula taiwanensis]